MHYLHAWPMEGRFGVYLLTRDLREVDMPMLASAHLPPPPPPPLRNCVAEETIATRDDDDDGDDARLLALGLTRGNVGASP